MRERQVLLFLLLCPLVQPCKLKSLTHSTCNEATVGKRGGGGGGREGGECVCERERGIIPV